MMVQYWMITTSEENFNITREDNFQVQGFKSSSRNKVSQVRPRDKFVIYIRGVSKFGGIISATSEHYFDDQNRIWIEEDEMWPERFHTTSELILNENEYLSPVNFLERLSFVSERQRAISWGLAFQGSLKRISSEDFRLIESQMRLIRERVGITTSEREDLGIGLQEQECIDLINNLPEFTEVNSLHDKIGKMLESIGQWFGYESYTRKPISDTVRRQLDVAWYKDGNPEIAFEIQWEGQLDSAIRKLQQARNFNYRKVIIVIRGSDLEELNRRLISEPIVHAVEAWSIKSIYELYDSAKKFNKSFKKLTRWSFNPQNQLELL